MIKIRLNGKFEEWDNDKYANLDALVKCKVKNEKGLIIELNQKLVNRNHWQEHQINDGDEIELINLVGGG
jgi:thiamine biosynthesis protein ThiS